MALRDYLPIFRQQAELVEVKSAQPIAQDDQKALMKTFKVAALALGIPSAPLNLNKRTNFEFPPYDFHRIIQAVDTDSYVQQAFNKYGELFWKEGWDIVSENSDAVDYLWQRIDFMEIAMNRPFQDFLTEVSDQLFKFHNVFIAKSRGNLKPYFPGKLETEDKDPIVGYYVLPTEQIEILRDRNNKPRWYRQRIDSSQGVFLSDNVRTLPIWKADEVIHLSRKKKPGRAFGTPFIISALDDVIALRQIEEDLQNLVHKELFPLYKYMIGTDDHPASPEEIEKAKVELDSLRSEGGLIMPHRHDVDVIGASGKALDAAPYLAHFKERLSIGLGLFPHHLGMSTQALSQSATDRLDIALYDRIKEYQRFFSNAVRFFMFNELLLEGGFDPFEAPQEKTVSDRCTLRFNEIDVDTQVKKEANVIQKVAAGLETIPEGRMELNMKPEMDESATVAAQQVRLMPDQPTQTKNKDGSAGAPKLLDTTPAAAKPNTTPSSKGGKPNMPNIKKGAGNVVRPTNQFGTRTSPNIRHSEDETWLQEVEQLLGDDVYLDDGLNEGE